MSHRKFTETASYLLAHNLGKFKKNYFYPTPQISFPHKETNAEKISTLLDNTTGINLLYNNDSIDSIRTTLEYLREKKFIIHYGEGPVFNDYPKFHYFSINYTISPETSNETHLAWGYCLPNEELEIAIIRSLGESLERQSSYYLPDSSFISIPKIKIGDASYLYPLIPKFTVEQINNQAGLVKEAGDLKRCYGFYAKSLTGDRARFFPFEAFYWGSKYHNDQKLIHHHTTSGSGGGVSVEKAVLSGWYELIERDHLLLYWLTGTPPSIIDNNTLSEPLSKLVKTIVERYKLEVYFLDLRYDTEIVVGACVLIDPILNKISMGAKAGTSGEVCLRGSLLEALAVISSTRQHNKAISEDELNEILSCKSFSKTLSRSNRVNLYASKLGISLIKKIFLSGPNISFRKFTISEAQFVDAKAELQQLVKIFKKLVKKNGVGYHAYLHEFKSTWLSALDYKAVHVYIPSFLKLHLNETLATPVSDRLFEFAQEKNKPNFDFKDINKLPHFFP